jgi:hypothetical protein
MWTQLRTAALATALLAGTVAVAHAQGSVTQDPGRITPGNLSTDRLGPSSGSPGTANGALGAGDTPNGNWSGTAPNPGRGAVGTMPGYGAGSNGMGSTGGGSTGAGSGSGATGNGPSGAGGTGAIGGGR